MEYVEVKKRVGASYACEVLVGVDRRKNLGSEDLLDI